MYTEEQTAGNAHRARAEQELEALLSRRREAAKGARAAWFRPDPAHYEEDLVRYRRQVKEMLGWPLTEAPYLGAAEEELVAEETLGKIYRCHRQVTEGLSVYYMLFVPRGEGPFPVALVQHGGLGTPERIAGFFGSANYNDMLRRVWERGILCVAPQLYLWGPDYGELMARADMDRKLKHLGSSCAALEVAMILSALEGALARPEADGAHCGMIGLSYGGFYTFLTAALEPRLRVAAESCCLTDRMVYDWVDWTFFNSANRFTDEELARMIAPRALFAECASHDEIFSPEPAKPVMEAIARAYADLGVAEKFRFKLFEGVHELSKDPEIIEFFEKHLRQ